MKKLTLNKVSAMRLEKANRKIALSLFYSTQTPKPKRKTPMQIAKFLIENKIENFTFDLKSANWFQYNTNVGAWTRLTDIEFEKNIFTLLIEDEGLQETLTSGFCKEVKYSIEMLMGVDFEINQINKLTKLVPFKNGVLDLNSREILNHNPNYHFTYSLNIYYDPDAILDNNIIEYLIRITNNNVYTLKVLRSFIQCLLLRDNQFQVALYLYGPGGTGKSTFEKLLSALVGNKNTTIINLQDLNKTFAISKIVDKNLVLFSDVQFYTGDPSKLRLLISGDIINAEKKYSDPMDIQPNCLVVLTSNMLWSPKDPSTGLQRRIIYIPVSTVPKKIDRNLFNYNLLTNEVSGTLAISLPGLVNWALANPTENLNLLNNAVSTNKLIDPSALGESNPLVEWIQSSLSYAEGSQVLVGVKNSNPRDNLFSNYLLFCAEFGYKSISIKNFSIVLVQQLNTLIDKSIERKKTNTTVITNIKINKVRNIDFISPTQETTSLFAEFEGFVDPQVLSSITTPPQTSSLSEQEEVWVAINTPSLPLLNSPSLLTSSQQTEEGSPSSLIESSAVTPLEDENSVGMQAEIIEKYNYNQYVFEQKLKEYTENNKTKFLGSLDLEIKMAKDGTFLNDPRINWTDKDFCVSFINHRREIIGRWKFYFYEEFDEDFIYEDIDNFWTAYYNYADNIEKLFPDYPNHALILYHISEIHLHNHMIIEYIEYLDSLKN